MKGPWDLQFEQLNAGRIQLENRGVSFGNAFLYHENYNQEVMIRGGLKEGLLAYPTKKPGAAVNACSRFK